jgi:small subunit ribosomal protein S8
MTLVDPISDMITRIRNAQMRLSQKVKIPSSKMRERILDVLKKEGFISDYKILSDELNKPSLHVDLKYNNGIPVIREISRISKPGRRVYVKADTIPRIQNGLGVAIVSTSKGIMSDNDARTQKIGGEIICKVL